jgi:ferredoxin
MANLKYGEETAEVKDGQSIVDAAENFGVPFGCSQGDCGTCIVEVVEGSDNLNTLQEAEKDFPLEDNERLACQCVIKSGDVEIDF